MTLEISTPLPQILKNRDDKRMRAYQQNLAFYEGEQWAGPRKEPYRRLTLNYARSLIIKTSGMIGAPHNIEIVPPNDSDEAGTFAEQTEDQIKIVYQDNDLARVDFDSEIDTAVLGDGAFKVVWSEEEERVIVTAVDVQGIFVWPLPHKLDQAKRIAHRYVLENDEVAELWGHRAGTKSPTVIEDWTEAGHDVWIDNDLILSEENDMIPILHYPNEAAPKRWNGVSDIDIIREVTGEINRHFSRVGSILELSGNPIAVLENVTESSDIEAVPGAVWELPENAKAYLLDLLAGGGVKLHVDFIDHLYRAMHDLAEVPRAAFAGLQRDLSGVALEIELRPLEQKVARKRIIRDAVFRRRAQMMLALLDKHTGSNFVSAGIPFVTGLPAVVPIDQAMDGGREVALVGAGISSRQSSMRRLDPDIDAVEEFELIKREGAELGAIAAALSSRNQQTPTAAEK